MSESTSQLGELLRNLRVGAGLSQEALAEASGVSVRTISDLERGQRHNAHLETARLLAGALDVTGDERRRLLEAARPDSNRPDGLKGAAPQDAFGLARWQASVPARATSLVGRASELDALSEMLTGETGGIVSLTGPGGVGKTRLAVEAALRFGSRYRDGAAWVELATVTRAELVPNAIARALGMTPQESPGLDQLSALLATRKMLLVLDNLEQVIEAAPFVAQLSAACPHMTVLVTSRVRLRVSREWEIALSPLSLAASDASVEQLRSSEAVQLFAERARTVDPRFELSDETIGAVSEVCRRLDGLPLAIELAASRLRVLSVPVLLERLDRRLPLLTGGDRDRPPRQQSMRETIAWSYELLDQQAKRFLQWMSVFVGGISLESGESLGKAIGLDPVRSVETLTTLIDYGLAARSGSSSAQPRFVLFETIREFALDQLAEAGEAEHARRFHAQHFLAFASRDAPPPYEPIPVAWVGRLSTEYPNLIAAFDFLCVPETAKQSLQFAAAMGPYWHTRGRFAEWQPRLSRAFALASPEPTILKVHVLFWLTLILGPSPDFAGARRAAGQCLEMAQQVGTPSDLASAIGITAWVHECHGQWETARELRNQSIAFAISGGTSYMHGVSLIMNALSAYGLGDLERAQRESEQAAELFRLSDSIDWSASTACTRGMFSVADGQLALGAEFFTQSLNIWMQSESSSRWYRPLVGLADVAAAIGHIDAAARLLGAADAMLIVGGRDLTFFDRPAYERAETRCREALGPVDFAQHRLAGSRLTPEHWVLEADEIVEAARATALPVIR